MVNTLYVKLMEISKVKKEKIDHRELKEDEYITCIHDDTPQNRSWFRDEYNRGEMKIFYDKELSPNPLLLVSFWAGVGDSQRDIFVIIDIVTKKNLKETRIRTGQRYDVNYFELNNIGIARAPLIRRNTVSTYGEITVGMIHKEEHKDHGVEYGVYEYVSRKHPDAFDEDFSGPGVKLASQNWNYFESPGNRYVASMKVIGKKI